MIARRSVLTGMGLAGIGLAGVGLPTFGCARRRPDEDVLVRFDTAKGAMSVRLYAAAAPRTVANFLRYVDAGLYSDASFYRTVRPAGDSNPVPINVIQGGLNRYTEHFPPVEMESTAQTGLTHSHGVLSMAREVPGWPEPRATSEFFICIGDNSALDAGGGRNRDGAGFAAFGEVVEGMKIVEDIHRQPSGGGRANWVGQMLETPVAIRSINRT